jgi:hypothetical protein
MAPAIDSAAPIADGPLADSSRLRRGKVYAIGIGSTACARPALICTQRIAADCDGKYARPPEFSARQRAPKSWPSLPIVMIVAG